MVSAHNLSVYNGLQLRKENIVPDKGGNNPDAIVQLLTSSRQSFAFARDGGLPLSRYIYRINPYTKTPVVGAWMAAILGVFLGLLAFAGPAAISAIFSLGIAGLNLAYVIPLAARIFARDVFRPGPFSLGKLVSLLV